MVQSITIIGRLWFEKTNGNTYHTAKILVDGKPVGEVPYSYGYGEQYIQGAVEKLEELGTIKRNTSEKGGHFWSEPLWQYCRRLGIALHTEAIDVQRKRDL